MYKATKLEKEQALKEFQKRQEKKYKTGKAIIFIIAGLNLMGTIISAFNNFDITKFVVQIILSMCLISGFAWARYLFAVGSALGATMMLYALVSISTNVYVTDIVIAVFYLIYCIVCSIILFTSKSVSEYLYKQQNG